MLVHEAQMRLEKKRRKFVEESSTRVPVGTLVLVKLAQQDRADYPGKFEQFFNGVTYRMQDLASAEQRQVMRDQFKVIDLPGADGDGIYQDVPELPRLVIPDVGHPPVKEDSGGETELRLEEPFSRSGACPAMMCYPPRKRNANRSQRAGKVYVQLPCDVPMQLKNAK